MCGTEQGIISFPLETENKNHQLGTGFFVRHRIVTAVKRVDVISDSASHTVASGISLF